jgi:coniferyl-aldehyde dehydrogenase
MTEPAKPSRPTSDARAGFTVAKEGRLWSVLAAQREAFLRDGAPSLASRRSDLLKLKQAILARRRDFEASVSADFGHRSAYETAIMEIMPTVTGIDYLHGNLRRWMRPQARHVAMHGREPKGAPAARRHRHHFTVELSTSLCLMPLATAIAGNRVMLKPSEYTKTSELIVDMLRRLFTEDQVAVVTGGSDIGGAAIRPPRFTGSTTVGRGHARGQREPGARDARTRCVANRRATLRGAAASSIAYGLSNAGRPASRRITPWFTRARSIVSSPPSKQRRARLIRQAWKTRRTARSSASGTMTGWQD